MPVPDFTVVIENDSREPQTWRVFNDAPFKALIQAVKEDKETGKTVLLPDTDLKSKMWKLVNMSGNGYGSQFRTL